MSDVEWEGLGDEIRLLLEEKARLEAEIAAERPSFDVERMMAWVNGHDADDAEAAARERLDIEPLIWRRAAELAETARSFNNLRESVDYSRDLYRLREDAIRALRAELRDACLVNVHPDEVRRRFLQAWDAQWPTVEP